MIKIQFTQGCDPAGLDVQAEVRAAGAGGCGLLSPVLGRDGLHRGGQSQQGLQRPEAVEYRRGGRRGDAGDHL